MSLLQDANHTVVIAGPQGEQVHYDDKGKRQKGGKARTDFIGYQQYLEELRVEAGLSDPDVEKIVKEIKRNRDFWGDETAGLVAEQTPGAR